MSCERALNFDQWKTFSENYKPMRVWLWLVYKFTENYYPSRLFSEFIQTQKRYPTSLDKICILTWKLLVISSWNFSCELNSKRTYSLQNISYLLLRLYLFQAKKRFTLSSNKKTTLLRRETLWWVLLLGLSFLF